VDPWHTSILVGGGTLDDAITFLQARSVGRRMLDSVAAPTQARAVQAVREVFAKHADADGVHLDAAVWLVQATA
jgi:hypothetical protein